MSEPSGLAAILNQSGLSATSSVLRLGRAGPLAERALDGALASYSGPRLVGDEAFGNWGRSHGFDKVDLCVIAVPPARTPDVIEDLLYDRVASALSGGGIAVLQFCRDATETGLQSLRLTPEAAATLRAFNETQFGAVRLDSLEPIKARFAGDGQFECVGWAPRVRPAVAGETLVWLVLRKRENPEPLRRAFARTSRPDRYPIAELQTFLSELSAGGIGFLAVDRFANETREAGNRAAPFGLLKLDIHRDIRRPVEIAQALSAIDISALFLMMHAHPFNAGLDGMEIWESIYAIRNAGHEVGLHVDPFHLIRTHGDLETGLARAFEDLAGGGIRGLRAATLHGDTSRHIVECGLNARDFFVEERGRSRWNGMPPRGEEGLAQHVGRYSFVQIAARFGIEYWVEANFRVRGALMSQRPLQYLTDNNRSLQLTNIPAGDGVYTKTCETPFRLPRDFARTILPELRARPFLALFHPQWFW